MSQWQPQATRSCVAVRARDCSNAFAAYLTDPAQISDREEWAEEQQARFNIWAANLGVFADGHASIDHRLRDSSKTYCLIFQLLDALYANLNYCIRGAYEIRPPEKEMDSLPKLLSASEEIVESMRSPEALDSSTASGDILEHHSKPPSRSSSFASVSTDRDSKFSPELLSEACLDIEGVIHRLNRLSTAIRKSGRHQSDGRAEEFEPKDEDGEDMTPEFKRFAAAVIRRDIPQATEPLRERVLESVTRRWRRLLYRRSHQAKLARRAKQSEIVLPTVTEQLPPGNYIEERSETRTLISKSDPSKLDQSPAPALSSTNASTLKSKDFSTVTPSVDNSSRVTRSSIKGDELDIPKPPKSSIKNNVFECPYCRILCPVKEASGSRWNEHFVRDLAPYICIFEECDRPQHAFRTSDDWITHMVREHIPTEWICLMHKSGSTLSTVEERVFRSEDDYMQHMYQSHGDSLAKEQLLALARISQRPATDVFKICQFCGGVPDDLEALKQDPDALQHAIQKHVGTHLQSLAMISLPWDSSQPGSVVSSDAVQGDYDDKPDPKNKKRPSEESDDGSDSESDHFHKPKFIDPPPKISNGTDRDLIDYWKLESKAPSEPYEPDLMDDFSIAISVDPVWDDPVWDTVLLGGREWEFMEDERPPYWKGELPYKGHSSNLKLTSFISAWMDRLANENDESWAKHGNLRKFWEENIPSIYESNYMKWVFDQLVGLADAIQTLHHQGEQTCRHGDLKPENVLCFDKSGSAAEKDQTSYVLVISDVGLSRVHDKSTQFRSKTRMVVGETIAYAAPETELYPERATSRRCDIWSLGCLYLEFVIWLLYGIEELKRFGEEINESPEQRFYTITGIETLNVGGSKTPKVNQVVTDWIEHIKTDWRCAGIEGEETAIGRLIVLVEKGLLIVTANPDPKDPITAPYDPGDEDQATANSGERTDIPEIRIQKPTALSEEARDTMISRTARFADTGKVERAYAPEVREGIVAIVQDVKDGVIEWVNKIKMDLLSLQRLLEDGFLSSTIDDKTFVPLDFFERIINKQNVKAALGITDGAWAKARLRKPSDLPDRVVKQAKRIFAALVLMDKVAAIKGLLDEGFTDEHLPLSRDPDHDTLLSRDRATTFSFVGWRRSSVADFVLHKQWLFLAPVLDTKGQLIEVDQECALPFTDSSVIGIGAAGVVYWAKLHKAHQRGFEAETVHLKVTIKQFLHKDDFAKENEILQQIKSLHHRHIIRHLASIDKGKGGYIIFPWADSGNLQEFWEASEQETSRESVLWSMRQMLGLTTALQILHEHFKCRHGDLKPGNILCVKEYGEIVLKIADFGVLRIHHAQTINRTSATTSTLLTPLYQGPEVEFERMDKTDQRPRSRKYDIWSLGCVFLEFVIWLLHGPKAIEGFASARRNGASLTSYYSPLYEVTDKAGKAARVHQLVSWTIERLEDNPQCKGETALAALLSLTKNQMLQPEVEDRPLAADICKQLENIVQEAEKRDSYLLHSCDGLRIPPLDFEKIQLVPNQEDRP